MTLMMRILLLLLGLVWVAVVGVLGGREDMPGKIIGRNDDGGFPREKTSSADGRHMIMTDAGRWAANVARATSLVRNEKRKP